MVQVVEETGAPSSNLVQGTGTTSATFTMPSNVALDVQSVVATIDNTAGVTDATATITIKDQAGEVIDANAQEDTIPAGDTGTATFARRLFGKRARDPFGGGGLGLYRDANVNVGVATSVQFDWNFISGDALLDVSGGNLNAPVVLYAGVYAITALTVTFAPVAGKQATTTLDGNSNSGISAEAAQTFPLDNSGTNFAAATPTFTNYLAVGDTLDLFLRHNAAAGVVFSAVINVQRIALR